MINKIEILHSAPDPEEYNALRIKAGLSPKNLVGAKIALNNSAFVVALRNNSNKQLVGMGRVIGDGGCFFQVVDIAVDPIYQGNGLGKLIMSEIMDYLDENVPKDSYVSLIADIPADRLYKKYGFDYTSPTSVGMYKKY